LPGKDKKVKIINIKEEYFMALIGKEISDFTVKAFVNGEFKDISKEDVLGKWAVFVFYPADFTFI
jgi:alkyl hydroperoxide reductase subunit AhpC